MQTYSRNEHRRPASIGSVYAPIEQLWTRSLPQFSTATRPAQLFSPLDALLVHEILASFSTQATLVDRAYSTTGGATSLVGLCHPNVGRVLAVESPHNMDPSVDAAIREISGNANPERSDSALTVVTEGQLGGSVNKHEQVLFLIDSGDVSPKEFTTSIARELAIHPTAVIAVLGLNRVGECSAIDTLVEHCGPASAFRFRLMRDLCAGLGGSRLGIVSMRENPSIVAAIDEIKAAFSRDFQFIDLLRNVNQRNLSATRIDSEVMRDHPLSPPLAPDMERMRRTIEEARGKTVAAVAAETPPRGEATGRAVGRH